MTVRRMWIDQPSSVQINHGLHGTRVLVEWNREGEGWSRAYFLEGPLISQVISNTSLADGWPFHITTARAAYVLAMHLLQRGTWETADDEVRAAVQLATRTTVW